MTNITCPYCEYDQEPEDMDELEDGSPVCENCIGVCYDCDRVYVEEEGDAGFCPECCIE